MENKPTFEEWKANQKCNECGNVLQMDFSGYGRTTHKLRDVDHEKVKGFYCNDCYEDALTKLKNSRFVERYRDQEIYHKNSNYSLWQSATYCKSLEDLHNWIDVRLNWLEKAREEWHC